MLGDYEAQQKDPKKTIGLFDELETIKKAKENNQKVEEKLEKNLNAQLKWWTDQGKENAEKDFPKLEEAKTFGAKQALLATAAVPAAMAVCYLLLILFYKVTGGYKQQDI